MCNVLVQEARPRFRLRLAGRGMGFPGRREIAAATPHNFECRPQLGQCQPAITGRKAIAKKPPLDVVRPLFISTYPPDESRLATYTKDSADAVDRAALEPVCQVAAIHKSRPHDYDTSRVVHVIDNNCVGAYARAAEAANDGPCDVVSLQHDFGLYPGEWGAGLLEFVNACRKPMVTTFHTLPALPATKPRRLIQTLAAASQGVVVMTHVAARQLTRVYGVPEKDVRVVPVFWPSAGRQYLDLFSQAASGGLPGATTRDCTEVATTNKRDMCRRRRAQGCL